MKKIAVVGAGAFARDVLSLVSDSGLIERVGYLYESDSIWTKRTVVGFEVRPLSLFDAHKEVAVIAIGSSAGRREISEGLPRETTYITLTHPNVPVGPRTEIGVGTVICAGSIISPDVMIGEHVQINHLTTIAHDSILEDFVTAAPAVHISGHCRIGHDSYLGTNACLRDRITITANTTIGMGSVVVQSIKSSGVYAGNPARELVKKSR